MTSEGIAEKIRSDLFNIIYNQIPPNIQKFEVSLLIAAACIGWSAADMHKSYPVLGKGDLIREITATLLRSVENVIDEKLEEGK